LGRLRPLRRCRGTNSYGNVFDITSKGTPITTLHSFKVTDGSSPESALVQHTNGKFYGATGYGGSVSDGTLFSLDMGLGPFVKFIIPAGKAGGTAQILGQGLSGTTSVTFNGVPATSFKVISDTYLTAVVPNVATTGPVVVTTPTGQLASNINFRISH
jgi:uncharacterized repeat protein (TIGR03803 family)